MANDNTFNLHVRFHANDLLDHDGVAQLWNTLETDLIAALFSKSLAIV